MTQWDITIHPGPPVSVRPFGKQGALTIGNTAAIASGIIVYATDQATALNGTAIHPGDSLAWPEFKALYLYADVEATAKVYEGTPSAPASIGAVLTGPVEISGVVPVSGDVNVAGSVAITGPVAISGTVPVSGNLNATVTGDVNVTSGTIAVSGGEVNVGGILTPVSVQGGGELLASQGPIASGATGTPISFLIPAPASGLLYSSFRLLIYRPAVPIAVAIMKNYTLTDANGTVLASGSWDRETVGTRFGYSVASNPNDIDVTGPITGAYPLTLTITNRSLNTGAGYNWKVFWSSAQVIETARDNSMFGSTGIVNITGSGTFILPPSHTPYRVQILTAIATSFSTFEIYGLIDDGVYVGFWQRPSAIPYTTTASGTYEFYSSGSGAAEKIAIISSPSNTITCAIQK